MSINSGRTNETFILWGAPLSLYAGKARSYLIKKGLPYRECFPTDPVFQTRILPQIGFFVVPVLETPDGSIVQDTTDIIEYLEHRFPEPSLTPATPVQCTVARLIDAFASEGLLRPAMHYRWSYLQHNEPFLRAEFGRVAVASRNPAERAAAAAPFMQAMHAYLPRLGVVPETIAAVEQSHEELLDILDAHFLQHPYLLGGRPSIADFGLMAPLFAHLGRDPYPSALMKTRAANVFRWTERMNTAGFFDGEFDGLEATYLPDDEIPETLEPLLSLIFRDWGPEVLATAERYREWLAQTPALPAGTVISETGERQLHAGLGTIRYVLRGLPITRIAMPEVLWHFDKAASYARTLSVNARARLDALLRRTGGESAMAITPARPLKRENFVLVIA